MNSIARGDAACVLLVAMVLVALFAMVLGGFLAVVFVGFLAEVLVAKVLVAMCCDYMLLKQANPEGSAGDTSRMN